MNTIDLCVTRKLVNQRYQNEKMESQKVIALQASNAMKTVRDCPTIENAIEFSLIENLYLMNSKKQNIKCYGTDVCQAIKTGNYTNTMPKLNKLGLGGNATNPEMGKLYIAQCATRPGQLKIGYTTLTIKKRFALHRDRYGENLTEYFSVDCPYPAKTEQNMERILKQYRYAITKKNESNEWYKCTESKALEALITALK